MIQGTETAIYDNESTVQETANTVTGEQYEDTPGEELTKKKNQTM